MEETNNTIESKFKFDLAQLPVIIFGTLGAVILALGFGYFIRVAIEYGWIGYGMRVMIGVVSGILLIVLGELARRSQMLKTWGNIMISAGLSISYFSIYASYFFVEYRESLGMNLYLNTFLLAIFSLAGVGLALKNNSVLITLQSLAICHISALFNDGFEWISLVYVLFTTIFVATVALYRKWDVVGLVILGMHYFFYLLMIFFGYQNMEFLPLFVLGVFGYVGFSLAALWRTLSGGKEELLLGYAFLNTASVFVLGAFWSTVKEVDVMGIFSFCLGLASIAHYVIYLIRPVSLFKEMNFFLAMIFVFLAIFLQLDYRLASICWAVGALALMGMAYLSNKKYFEVAAYTSIGFVLLKLLVYDLVELPVGLADNFFDNIGLIVILVSAGILLVSYGLASQIAIRSNSLVYRVGTSSIAGGATFIFFVAMLILGEGYTYLQAYLMGAWTIVLLAMSYVTRRELMYMAAFCNLYLGLFVILTITVEPDKYLQLVSDGVTSPLGEFLAKVVLCIPSLIAAIANYIVSKVYSLRDGMLERMTFDSFVQASLVFGVCFEVLCMIMAHMSNAHVFLPIAILSSMLIALCIGTTHKTKDFVLVIPAISCILILQIVALYVVRDVNDFYFPDGLRSVFDNTTIAVFVGVVTMFLANVIMSFQMRSFSKSVQYMIPFQTILSAIALFCFVAMDFEDFPILRMMFVIFTSLGLVIVGRDQLRSLTRTGLIFLLVIAPLMLLVDGFGMESIMQLSLLSVDMFDLRIWIFVPTAIVMYVVAGIVHYIRFNNETVTMIYRTILVILGSMVLFGYSLLDFGGNELTIVWSLFGFALLIGGVILRYRLARVLGICVLMLAVLKIFTVDIFNFGLIMRMVAFFVLGISLIVISLLYAKFRDRIGKI